MTLVTAKQAREILGNVSDMFLWRRLRDDEGFPRPVQYTEGGPRYFDEAELRAWIAEHRGAT